MSKDLVEQSSAQQVPAASANLSLSDGLLSQRALTNADVVEVARALYGVDITQPGMLEGLLVAIDRDQCSRHFYYFVRQAYCHAYGEQFIDGWHIGAMCYHLQALWEGTLQNEDGEVCDTLVLNAPPGCGKSRIMSCLYPAWLWAVAPEAGMWFTSFGQGLCDRDALDTRRLITSDWYRKRFWPDTYLMDDANQKRRYNNNKGGWRLSASIESRVGFGEHPSALVCVPFDGVVETSEGGMLIGEIVDERRPVQVLSFNHESGSVERDEIVEYEENPGKELIEIELDDGTVLTVTEDHPVFIDGVGYIEACRIQPGQQVLTMGSASSAEKTGSVVAD
jgi:hypothetical protein